MTDVAEKLAESEWDALPEAEQDKGVEAKLGPNPEAPYGYKKDGTPYKRRPNGAGKGRSTGGGGRRKKAPDYADGINGVFQIAATALAIAGDKKPVLLADSIAITMHGPNIAEGLNQLAQERPEVAAVLERILQVGPYGLVIGATFPLVFQLLTNHGVAPAGLLGTHKPEDLIASVMPKPQTPDYSEAT